MNADFASVFSSFLVYFQKESIHQTGRRPIVALDSGVDEELLLPGCKIDGYSFWQPMPWLETPELGKAAERFDGRILQMLTMCRYFEVSFTLPVPSRNSVLSYLFNRNFLLLRNTLLFPPVQRLEQAVKRSEKAGDLPLFFPFAVTDSFGEAAVLTLRGEDARVFLSQPERASEALALNVSIDELLPHLKCPGRTM